MSELDKRLEEATRQRQAVLDKDKSHKDSDNKFLKAMKPLHEYSSIAVVLLVALAAVVGMQYVKPQAPQTLITATLPHNEDQRTLQVPSDNKSVGKEAGKIESKAKIDSRVDVIAKLSGAEHTVRMTEDVNAFISRMETAFEKGDLAAYLSCYSQLAVENGMDYQGIRDYYKAFFKKGRIRMAMGNMIISKERTAVAVSGLYTLKTGPDGATAKVVRGTYSMLLVKLNGTLKIRDYKHADSKQHTE
ncbi:MAG TPA: hypothetical protein VK452_02690 [Dissulfurispiraceae bacterium]|nr:hypothetical protein [Dissulfurispiraceae bacterium]